MEPANVVKPKKGDVVLLIGTMKGAFLASANSARRKWQVAGPYFQGESVYSLAYDGRKGRQRVWAGTRSFQFGPALRSTDDFGKTWMTPETPAIAFPANAAGSLTQIWQIQPGRAEEPEVLYCGVEPAALFQSSDSGQSWMLSRGLYDHPHRQQWMPGGGGLCLHAILPDPSDRRRMHVGISTGGVYRTEDGGESWRACNKNIRVDFMPEKFPEFGQCVHRIVRHPARPGRLFLQNHGGLYRSDDQADSWRDIAKGVPSDFGFAMEIHPHDPDSVFIVPLEPAGRWTPDAKLRVYRTGDAGRSWEPLSRGLPQKGAYETVLRHGLSADTLRPCGLYFGTRSGKVFASRTEGNSWEKILDGFPAIVSVKAAVIGDVDGVEGEPQGVGGRRGNTAAKTASGSVKKASNAKIKTPSPRRRK